MKVPPPVDAMLALAVTVLSLTELALRSGTAELASPLALAYAASTASLAWRRLAPIPVALLVLAMVLGPLFAGASNDNLGQFVAYLLSAYSVGAHTTGRAARFDVLVGYLVVVGGGAVAVWLVPRDSLPPGDAVGMVVLIAGAGLLGRALRSRDQRVDVLQSEQADLIAARAEREARAVADERARIARELHDIVGHAMSLMVLLVGAGRKTVRSDPERTEAILHSAEETGRQGLTEMKRLVGIMRQDDGSGDLSPQPDLSRLPELVRGAESAGLDVECLIEGDPVPLPAGVGLSAYRIVQEAITNSVRHSGGSALQVRVSYAADAVTVAVTDDGPDTRRNWLLAEPGHGLTGIRERVSLYGGSLSLGPAASGGFAVTASLPLAETS